MELYKATKDAKYLNDAKANFEGNDVAWALSWDDNHVMCEVSESCLPWIRLATIWICEPWIILVLIAGLLTQTL